MYGPNEPFQMEEKESPGTAQIDDPYTMAVLYEELFGASPDKDNEETGLSQRSAGSNGSAVMDLGEQLKRCMVTSQEGEGQKEETQVAVEGQEEETQGVEVICVEEDAPSAEKPKAVSEDSLAALQALLGDFNLLGLENPKHLRTQSFLQAEVLFVKSHWANPSNSVSGTVRAGSVGEDS